MTLWWSILKFKYSCWLAREDALPSFHTQKMTADQIAAAFRLINAQKGCREASQALIKHGGPRAVKTLIAGIKGTHSSVQCLAAKSLGDIGDARAASPLIELLKHKDTKPIVCEAAAEALAKMGDHAAPRLVEMMGDTDHAEKHRIIAGALRAMRDASTDKRQRARYAVALGDYNMAAREGPAAIEWLVEKLKSDNHEAVLHAVKALGQIGDASAVGPLISAFSLKVQSVRNTIIKVLSGISSPQAVEFLINVQKEASKNGNDDETSSQADVALVKMGSIAVGPLIAELCNIGDSFRCQAAQALGKIRDVRAVEPLCEALTDSSKFVRKAAADALSMICDARAMESLCAALKDGDPDVRKAAADALRKVCDARTVLPLCTALKDSSASVRKAAAETLGNIRDPYAVESLCAALKDGDLDVRKAAAAALGIIGGARVVEPLCAALTDSSASVRKAAAETLGNIEDPQAVEPLCVALKDCDLDVRKVAAAALGIIGDARVVEPLCAALNDSSAFVRRTVARALSRMRDERAVEPFCLRLEDTEESVRVVAAEALYDFGDARAVGPLCKALHHSDLRMRKTVVEALGKIGDARAVGHLIAVLGSNDDDSKMVVESLRALKRRLNSVAFGEELNHAVKPLIESQPHRLINILSVFASDMDHEVLRRAVSVSDVTELHNTGEWIGKGEMWHGRDCWHPLEQAEFNRENFRWERVVVSDFSTLRQLARQELIRRGIKA